VSFSEWLKKNMLIAFVAIFIPTLLIQGFLIGGPIGFVIGFWVGWGFAYLIYKSQGPKKQDND
jgi:hypothetical protein